MFPTHKGKKAIICDAKKWFIIVENQQMGPYSLLDLKYDYRFTPDTLVWKKGFKDWIKARFVPEMKVLFEDEPNPQPLHEREKSKKLKGNSGREGQAILALQQDPYQYILWLLLFLLLIFYTLYQLYYH